MTEARERGEDGRRVTCDDCFFRRADLCALPGNTPCPTFRRAAAGPRARGPELVAVARAAQVPAAA